MSNNLLVVNAIGGLCNRILTIAACVRLARKSQHSLKVIWHNSSELAADFSVLFKPLPGNIEICHPGRAQYLLKWEMPRKRNCYLSAIYQKMRFEATYTDVKGIPEFNGQYEDFTANVTSVSGNILIISGSLAAGVDNDLFRSLFHPSAEVAKLIESKTKDFDRHTVGVHIRRTDHANSIKQSPIYIFEREMQRCITEDPLANFFLATDDTDVMNYLHGLFDERICFGDNTPSRNSLRGMIEGTADLWALSKTTKILGSFHSSYSHTAALISGIPLIPCSLTGNLW